MQEKRLHPRHPLAFEVIVHTPDGQQIRGHSQDLSLGGMFVRAAQNLPFGTAVEVELPLPGLGQVRLPATVRWTKPDGLGVQFGLIGARQTHAISALVVASQA